MIINIKRNNTVAVAPIQRGLKTHHHDQAITSVSFKTIKTIVNNPINPIFGI